MSITVDFKKQIAFDKAIAITIALLLVVPFSSPVNLMILIVLSYGHFGLAHLYQLKKSKPSISAFVLFVLGLIGFLLFSHQYIIEATILVLSCTFLHGFWDEFKLAGEETNALSGSLVLIIALTQIIWLIDNLYPQDFSMYVEGWLVLSSLFLIGLITRIYFSRGLHLTTNIIIFSLTHIVFIGAYLSGVAMTALIIFRVLVHFHIFSWYIEVGRKYWKSDKSRFNIYIRDVFLMNTVFVAGFFLFKTWPSELHALGFLFYSLGGYYAWSMMHLISTFRLSDYKNMFTFPQMVTGLKSNMSGT